jgi:3-dehydrosphinganine reductase
VTDSLAAAKAAQRDLADLLRYEVTRYSGLVSEYQVQILFTHISMSPGALETQKHKPELTKLLEGSQGDEATLAKKFPSAAKIAPELVADITKGDFVFTDRNANTHLLWANMMGTSPVRGLGIVDYALSMFMGCVLWPSHRRMVERVCKGDALRRD